MVAQHFIWSHSILGHEDFCRLCYWLRIPIIILTVTYLPVFLLYPFGKWERRGERDEGNKSKTHLSSAVLYFTQRHDSEDDEWPGGSRRSKGQRFRFLELWYGTGSLWWKSSGKNHRQCQTASLPLLCSRMVERVWVLYSTCSQQMKGWLYCSVSGYLPCLFHCPWEMIVEVLAYESWSGSYLILSGFET